MGKAFFTGWQLWEKMVFVLACSIVVTILAGCIKLCYDHWRIRQYVKNPPKVELNREKSIIRSLSRRSAKTPMIQKRPRVVNDGIEIPFGIRAIESGIEVDGVWISRSNTSLTLPTSRESSGNSLWNLQNVSMSDISYRTEPNMQSRPLMSASRPQSRIMNRSVSQDSIASDLESGGVIAQPDAARYPPHSYMRYENGRYFRKSRAMNSSDNLSRPVSSYDGSNRSSSVETTARNNSTSSDEGSPSYHNVPAGKRRQVDYTALDMLQAHRLSHAAETGQLVPRSRESSQVIPRSRQPGRSGDWANIVNFAPIVSGEVVNFSLPRLSTDMTPPGSSGSNGSNPFMTPSTESSSVDFPEPQSASTDRSSKSYEMLPSVRRASSSFSAGKPDASVLREVNSGFSVLKPGTLDAEAQVRAQRNRSTSPPQRRRSRSVSIDTQNSEKRRSRRLQKKRRPSQDSISGSNRTSVSMETHTRASVDDRKSLALDIELQPPTTIYGRDELSRPPSPLEIALGAEFERTNSAKFSFDAGQRPPSAIEMAKGAEMDARAKYKL